MADGVYTLLPGTVASTNIGHGRGIGLIDLTGDGRPELIVTEAPENSQLPWDGVIDLFPPLLTISYDAVGGLSSVRLVDQADQIVRAGAANDLLMADFTGTGRPSFIAVSCGPEVLIPTAKPGSQDYVLDQIKLVTPNGDGGSKVSIVSAGYANQSYATSYAEPGFGFWHSAAAGDFNGDGTVDVIAANWQTGLDKGPEYDSLRTAAFLNDGNGQFNYDKDFLPHSFYQFVKDDGQTRTAPPTVLAAGDLNGDGQADIVWGTGAYTGTDDPVYKEIPHANRIYFNTGTGLSDSAQVLLPLPAESEFAALGIDITNIYADRVRIADLNNDGLQDIIFTYLPHSAPGPSDDPSFAQVWLQNPDHTFRDAPIWANHALPVRTGVVDAVDVNGDGLLDLVSNTAFLQNLRDAESNVWINTGGDNFESMATLAPDVIPSTDAVTSWWFANLDGSGPAELVVAKPNKDYTASSLAAYSLKPAAIQSIAGQVTKGTIFADQITGSASADTINAGLGHDRIASGNGADIVDGGLGDDAIDGGAGNDQLTGGGGGDVLSGGKGADRMDGGEGDDTYIVDNAGDVIIEASGQGTDTVKASVSSTLSANVENLTLFGSAAIGGIGNDFANKITGNTGANRLVGGGGADTIKGGAGNDSLFGGTGKDLLTGGTGQDFFVFHTGPGAANVDRVTDFNGPEGDKIQLSKAAFKAFGYTGTLHADDFYAAAGATKAHDATDRLVYNTTTGALYYDADGLGGAAAVPIAMLGASTHPALVFGDLQIIA